jgi:hypothetical protein
MSNSLETSVKARYTGKGMDLDLLVKRLDSLRGYL